MKIKFADVKAADPCSSGWEELLQITGVEENTLNIERGRGKTFELGAVAKRCDDWDDVEWILGEVIPIWKLLYFNLMLFERFFNKTQIPEEYKDITTRIIVHLWNIVRVKNKKSNIKENILKEELNEVRNCCKKKGGTTERHRTYHTFRRLLMNSERLAEIMMMEHPNVSMKGVTDLLTWID